MPFSFDPRQGASAFNQPLSFDTSSVTTMRYMFMVRSSYAPPRATRPGLPRICSRALSCTLRAPRSPAASPGPHCVYALLSILGATQEASAFNQPLSFDTSSVTNMGLMFRSAGAFNQPLSFDTSRVTDMYLMFYGASAFNQPLSFDTSSVTDMLGMFHVPRALPPVCSRALPYTLRASRSPAALPPPGPHLPPHRMPSFRLSAARVGVQPAAELRHLQRHQYGLHVLGALLPVPYPQSAQSSPVLHAACTAVARRLSRLPTRMPRTTRYALLSTLGSARRRSTSR